MPDKIQAVTNMTTPTSVTELQCFLGMSNFLSKLSPRMAKTSEPLFQLTCNCIPFIWGPEDTEAFQLLKRKISTAPILRYYNPKKPGVLQTDVCTKGPGAVLLQDGHPVYFASKSLTTAQQNYVAIELGSFSCFMGSSKVPSLLVWETFHAANWPETTSSHPQQIPSGGYSTYAVLLPTIPYDMTVKYIKGETNFIADCLSRALVLEDTIKLPILQVNQITAHARCTQDKINQLRQSTAKDDTLALLKHTIQHKWLQTVAELPPELHPYWTFRMRSQ